MGYIMGIQSNALKEFNVTIDGTKITNNQIHELRMVWNVDGFKIIGSLAFSDETGLIEELPIRGGNTVVMSMKDYDDVVSTQSFKVVEVSNIRGVTKPLVTLSLIDPITLTAMQKHPETSWSSENIVGIIDHIDTMKPSLVGKKKDFSSTPPKHSNFCTPLHVSFNVVMHWLAKNADVMLYQTRKDFVIQPLKELFSRAKKGNIFYLKPPNENYRRFVYEHSLHLGKLMNATTLQPTAKIASFDPSNKHSKFSDMSFSSSRGKMAETASFGATDDSQEATETKYFYSTDYHISEISDKQWSKHAYKDLTLELLVPGQFDTNIGDIVEVDFTNWLNKETTPEKNLNGLWFIIEVIDIIKPPEFAQRLTLGRSKYWL